MNPALVNMNSLVQRRSEKAVQLNDRLQHVKDKYSISSNENKTLSLKIAKKVLEKNVRLDKKAEAKNKENDKNYIIEKYKQGKVSYADVEKYIEQLDATYSTITNTMINVGTGIMAMTAGIAVNAIDNARHKGPMIMCAAIAAGALAKVGFSILERSNNNIKGDEFVPSQIAKDAACGAINGAFSGVSAGIGNTITSGYLLRKGGFEIVKQTVMGAAVKEYTKSKTKKSIAY